MPSILFTVYLILVLENNAWKAIVRCEHHVKIVGDLSTYSVNFMPDI